MKKNELLEIAGQEFILSSTAAVALERYLRDIKKKYRFQPSIRKSLEEALRDVLISYQAGRSNVITKPKATSAIAIVGDKYEEDGLAGKALRKLTSLINRVLREVKKLTQNQKARNGIYIFVAIASTVSAIALATSAWNASHSNEEENPSTTYTIQTTIGSVRSSHWADLPDFPDYPQGIEQAIAGSITCLLIAVFFIMVVRTYKYKLLVLALVVVSGATWLFLAHITHQDREHHKDILNSTITPGIETVRTTKNLDYLLVCGTEIHYVMGEQSGRLFYAFQDMGFKLKTELKTDKPYVDPTREQICTAYDQLRQSHTDDEIVLQLFIQDIHGTIRPFDYEETYTTENGSLNRYPPRYGFFVKTEM